MDEIYRKIALRFPAQERKNLLRCLISTFFFGLAAHAYGLFNNIYSHDSLNALYADSTENLAKIAVGRFLVPVARSFRGAIALPWVIGLISFVLIGLSAYVTVKIFDVKSKTASVLISAVMTANVTVTAIGATYVHEMDMDMLALLLALLAVFIWRKKEKITALIPAALLITASMALYQSYAEVAVTVIIFALMLDILNEKKAKDVFICGVKGAAMIGVGGGIYAVLNKIICTLMNTENLDRVNVLSEYEVSLTGRLVSMFKAFATTFISPASVNSTLLTAFANLAVIGLAAAAVIVLLVKKKIPAGGKLLTLLLVAMLPFGMNVVGLLTHEGVHDVMKFAFWFVYVFAIVLAARFIPEIGRIRSKNIISGISIVLLAVIVWNNILVSNAAYLKKNMEHDVTVATINRVIEDLEERDDYVVGETEVALVGYVSVQKTYPGFESVSRIVGLRQTMANGALKNTEFFNPYEDMFTYFFNYPINLSRTDYRDDPRLDDMPSFPEKGYIQNIDGVLIVKLGVNTLDSIGASDIEKDLVKIKNIFA